MFHGSLVALVTPMKNDGGIDYASLEALIDWHVDSGTDGLVILGTTGESATILPDERRQIIMHVVKKVKEKLPVIVGTGSNSTCHSVELTKQAMELGADGALLVTPYYNKPTQAGLYQHYKKIADAVPLPQILYNVPTRTGCDMLPDVVLRLAKECKNIVGVKEATGDLARLKALVAMDSDIDLLSGDDGTALDFMLQGGKGVISVVANVVPQWVHQMCQAALSGERQTAISFNQKMKTLYKLLFIESNPIPTKWALASMGKIKPNIRLPLTPLDKRYHQDLKNALLEANIHIDQTATENE